MQKVRSHFVFKLKFLLLIELPIQIFSPVLYLLFNVPSRYFSLSLNVSYLALEDGSPLFRQAISHPTNYFSYFYYYGTFTLYGLLFQTN